MRIASMDMGKNLGLCLYRDGCLTVMGITLPKNIGRRMATYGSLVDLIAASVDCVCFERVTHHSGTDAAHHYGFYMNRLLEACDAYNVKTIPVHVKTIKKHCGMGDNISKEGVKRFINSLLHTEITNDNMTDSVACLVTAFRDLPINKVRLLCIH